MTKIIDRTNLETIELSTLDESLAADLDADGFAAFFAAEFDGDFRTGNGIHIAWHDKSGRAGLVYVGSGSSGMTSWTDAGSPEDALRRYLDDEMRP